MKKVVCSVNGPKRLRYGKRLLYGIRLTVRNGCGTENGQRYGTVLVRKKVDPHHGFFLSP